MTLLTGHVFVVPGSIDSLDCDDIVVPTDHEVHVTSLWRRALGWTDSRASRMDLDTIQCLSEARRVAELPERGDRRRWLLSVGNGGGDVDVLMAGLEQALRAIAATTPLKDRVVRRVGLPTLGVARGGYGDKRGEVIRKLLATADRLAQELTLDVVFVAFNASMPR